MVPEHRRDFAMTLICGAALALSVTRAAPAIDEVYMLRPPGVWRLIDLNDDGDFFDFGESSPYAVNLPANSRDIIASDHALYVSGGNPTILLIRDLNGDGDALDFGEVQTFLNDTALTTAGAMVDLEPGGLLVMDESSTTLHLVRDLNDDGDALDAGERVTAATGLPPIRHLARRPDGKILAATTFSATPVIILDDRNGDGDYDDYAEALSYVESEFPGSGLLIESNSRSFLASSQLNRIWLLDDWTGDDDALDFGELRPFAEGVNLPADLCRGSRGLYVVTRLERDTLFLLQDLNDDGDALDVGEGISVFSGLPGITAIACPLDVVNSDCLAGDMNADGVVSTADIPSFASALITGISSELCRSDLNQDGATDGRDIPGFIAQMTE